MTSDPDRDDPFLTTSCQAMRTSMGVDALDALGWWDLLPHLDDADAEFRWQIAPDARDSVAVDEHVEHAVAAVGGVD